MGNPIVGAVRRRFHWDHVMDPRIAWLSPMPPAKSGIATYSRAVLDGLDRIGYTREHHKIAPIWPVKQKHASTLPYHTMAVYHLGNNIEYHGDIYDHAIRTLASWSSTTSPSTNSSPRWCGEPIRSATRRHARRC